MTPQPQRETPPSSPASFDYAARLLLAKIRAHFGATAIVVTVQSRWCSAEGWAENTTKSGGSRRHKVRACAGSPCRVRRGEGARRAWCVQYMSMGSPFGGRDELIRVRKPPSKKGLARRQTAITGPRCLRSHVSDALPLSCRLSVPLTAQNLWVLGSTIPPRAHGCDSCLQRAAIPNTWT